VIGFAAFFLSFLVNGAIQGTEWVNGGLPIWTVLPALRAWGTVRIMGGALVVTSFVMFAYNIIATVVVRPPFELPDLTSDMGAAEMPTTRPTTPAVTAGAEAVSL
jgi:cbb3-type cytochrome oxidase subunit 1